MVQVVQVADLDGDLPARVARPGRSAVTAGAPARNGPMIECGSVSSWPGVPWAITVAPLAAGPGTEFDDPVGGADELPFVLHYHHRIAVAGQGGDGVAQALDVDRVQPDRRLVQHVEHAGGAGPHGRGEFDALPLSRWTATPRPGRG